MDISKLGFWFMVSGVASALGFGLLLATESGPKARSVGIAKSAERLELEAMLAKLKRTWRPNAKARIVAEIRGRLDWFKAEILHCLRSDSDPFLRDVIYLVQELPLPEARPLLARIAKTAVLEQRPWAIVAADRILPWSRAELTELLQSKNEAVLRAALIVSSRSANRPIDAIIGLLGHAEKQIRETALGAIPFEMKPVAVTQLVSLARRGGSTKKYAVRALGRTKIVPQSEAALIEVLDSHDSELRVAALDALATKQTPLHNPAALWQLVCNEEIDPVERARACYCLERTKSIDPATVLEKLHNLHPYVRYFAARCLIAAGERKGIGVLLDLLHSNEQRFVGKDRSKLDSVRAESRKLLKYLSRSWISEGEAEWREWFRQVAELRPRVLPPPIASATVSAKPVRPSPLR